MFSRDRPAKFPRSRWDRPSSSRSAVKPAASRNPPPIPRAAFLPPQEPLGPAPGRLTGLPEPVVVNYETVVSPEPTAAPALAELWEPEQRAALRKLSPEGSLKIGRAHV